MSELFIYLFLFWYIGIFFKEVPYNTSWWKHIKGGGFKLKFFHREWGKCLWIANFKVVD